MSAQKRAFQPMELTLSISLSSRSLHSHLSLSLSIEAKKKGNEKGRKRRRKKGEEIEAKPMIVLKKEMKLTSPHLSLTHVYAQEIPQFHFHGQIPSNLVLPFG
jgi:hypothetical protein